MTTTTNISDALRRLLEVGAETGYLPVKGARTNNVWRSALKGVELGLAREVEGDQVAITAAGCVAIGAPVRPELEVDEPATDDVPTVQVDAESTEDCEWEGHADAIAEHGICPVCDPGDADLDAQAAALFDEFQADEAEEADEVEPAAEPTLDPARVAEMASTFLATDTPAEEAEVEMVTMPEITVPPAPANPGRGKADERENQIIEPVEGLRVFHVRPVVGGCTKEEHRHGVMTGKKRFTQKAWHAQVTLDCGHTRWPLLRVLIAEQVPAAADALIPTPGHPTGCPGPTPLAGSPVGSGRAGRGFQLSHPPPGPGTPDCRERTPAMRRIVVAEGKGVVEVRQDRATVRHQGRYVGTAVRKAGVWHPVGRGGKYQGPAEVAEAMIGRKAGRKMTGTPARRPRLTWEQYRANHPEVLASYRQATGYDPVCGCPACGDGLGQLAAGPVDGAPEQEATSDQP